MKVNRRFSVRGSDVLNVDLSGVALVSGLPGDRRVLTLSAPRDDAPLLPGRAEGAQSLAINMDPLEARHLARLLLDDQDSLMRLAKLVAALDPAHAVSQAGIATLRGMALEALGCKS